MPEELTQERQSCNSEAMECQLGDVTLPVPPRRMRVKQTLKIDEIEIQRRSGKVKQPIGYEDAEITVELELCDREEGGQVVETAGERLSQLQRLFRASRKSLPQPVEIVSTLTEACGVRQVLIKELEVGDGECDSLECSLQLVEFESVENQLKQQAAEAQAAATAEAKGEESFAGDAKLNEALGNPDEDYLIQQYDRGKVDAMGEEYSDEDAD